MYDSFVSQSLYLVCFLCFAVTTTKGSNWNAAPFDSIARALDLSAKFILLHSKKYLSEKGFPSTA